jgi:hypothetical protein
MRNRSSWISIVDFIAADVIDDDVGSSPCELDRDSFEGSLQHSAPD